MKSQTMAWNIILPRDGVYLVKLGQMRRAVTLSKSGKRSEGMLYKHMEEGLQRTFPISILLGASSHVPLLHRPISELGQPL